MDGYAQTFHEIRWVGLQPRICLSLSGSGQGRHMRQNIWIAMMGGNWQGAGTPSNADMWLKMYFHNVITNMLKT